MKIVTWNVNSVKSRLEHLTKYLRETSPDVVLLQELKCETDAFPRMEVEDCGYNLAIHGQKTYNGVAILSKFPLEDVLKNFDETDEQARYIEAVTNGVRVASVYVPNGQEPNSDKFQYKMQFFEKLRLHMKNTLEYDEKFVVGGDYNVAPEDIDVFDPKGMAGTTCFHPDEQIRFKAILNLGFTDAFRAKHQGVQKFSWWDYRAGAWQYNKGMRIDHFLLSPQAADVLKSSDVDSVPRGWEKPSDHAPVWVEL